MFPFAIQCVKNLTMKKIILSSLILGSFILNSSAEEGFASVFDGKNKPTNSNTSEVDKSSLPNDEMSQETKDLDDEIPF